MQHSEAVGVVKVGLVLIERLELMKLGVGE